MKAIEIQCPNCTVKPGEFCAGVGVYIGRFHRERVVASAKKTKEANVRARAASKGIIL